MKILYAITKSNWGGAQRHVFDLATSMKDRGHDVWVAVGGNGILKEKLEAAGIYTFSIASLGRDISVGKDTGSFREIYTVIRNKKPDVLHLHSPKAAGLGAVAGRILHVPFIVTTIHGWTFNEGRPFFERIIIGFFSWLTVMLSHATIVLSQKELDQGRHFPWAEPKLHLIPLGLKSPTFMSVDGAKQTLAKMMGMDVATFSKKTVIGTIAELHPNKGLKYLVEAATTVIERLPGSLFVVIGEGEERAHLEEMVKRHKIEDSFRLLGYVDDASQYLKAFSMLVLPSVKEGLPYVLLEAGAASLPAVATTVGGIPEIIDDMKSGILVQPENSRELGHAISFMIEHPEERRKYGTVLKEKVASKYSLETMVTGVENLYAQKTRQNSKLTADL